MGCTRTASNLTSSNVAWSGESRTNGWWQCTPNSMHTRTHGRLTQTDVCAARCEYPQTASAGCNSGPRVDSRRPSDVVRRATKEHTHTNCGCARTCRVHAQCVAGGVRVSWTMVHHRISHNATLPSEDHTSTPWTGSVAIGPRSPRMILPRADLLHTVIRTPLPYALVPAYVTFRASASSFGPPFPHRARGAGHPALRAGCKTREHSDYRQTDRETHGLSRGRPKWSSRTRHHPELKNSWGLWGRTLGSRPV